MNTKHMLICLALRAWTTALALVSGYAYAEVNMYNERIRRDAAEHEARKAANAAKAAELRKHIPTGSGIDENMKSRFIGRNADVLVKEYGIPNRDYPLSSGGQLLEFTRSYHYLKEHPCSDNLYGAHEWGNCAPPEELIVNCPLRFDVDPKGVVTKWSWMDECADLFK